MITKSKLIKLTISKTRKKTRKTILYAYKTMCDCVKKRAKNGHFYYSFYESGYSEELEIAFRFFRSKHKDLIYKLEKEGDDKHFEIRW